VSFNFVKTLSGKLNRPMQLTTAEMTKKWRAFWCKQQLLTIFWSKCNEFFKTIKSFNVIVNTYLRHRKVRRKFCDSLRPNLRWSQMRFVSWITCEVAKSFAATFALVVRATAVCDLSWIGLQSNRNHNQIYPADPNLDLSLTVHVTYNLQTTANVTKYIWKIYHKNNLDILCW